MKAFTSIFQWKRRSRGTSESASKRPTRSFASTFALLEGRALLSVIGPVAATVPAYTATTEALIASTAIPPAPPDLGQSTFPSSHNKQSGSSESNGGGGSSGGSGGGGSSAYHVQPDDPVAMDVARVTVDGQVTSEFALADFDTSEVFVRLGSSNSSVELGPAQGINHPDSVTLATLSGDDIPDLVVANTNGNNLLIFPGLGNGQFGPALDGVQGIPVGIDPVSVNVNYVNGNADQAQLIVANAESNSITVLSGEATTGGWIVTSSNTIETPPGSEPVKTLTYDINGDGNPDLLVCNIGSDDVSLYAGLGGGLYAPFPTVTYAVGSAPDAMLIGTFDDRHAGPDLVTVNSGSNDLTFIGDVFGPQPTSETISSGGITPDAAFAIDPGHTGVLDLVVANGGDGHMAVFRGGNDGLQLAGVITQASVPTPTAVVPASWNGGSLAFFAASAGDDAALLLQFDLGVASTYLPGTSDTLAALGQGDGELFAQLMPLGETSLDLIAVFWGGGPESDAVSAASNFREPSTITALYSPTEGQGDEQPTKLPEGSSEEPPPPAQVPAAPSKIENSNVANAISGVGSVLESPHVHDQALAAQDRLEESVDRPNDGLASLDSRATDRPFEHDDDIVPGVFDEVIRLDRSASTPQEGLAPGDSPSRIDSFPGFDGVDAPPLESRLETVPLISMAVVLSTRVILNASRPRPPAFGGKSRPRRFVSLEHNRQSGTGPDSV
jgi:hypothetical protein